MDSARISWGISKATVSKALNGRRRRGGRTEYGAIFALARKSGYVLPTRRENAEVRKQASLAEPEVQLRR
ncbi:MAG: hypothetical protein ACLRIL_09330 [Fusicatenibacter saccharivorans]